MTSATERVRTVLWFDGTRVMRKELHFEEPVTVEYVMAHPGLLSFHASRLFGTPVFSNEGRTATFTRQVPL